MALTINTNIFSLTAQAALSSNAEPLQTSLQRLSTGLRINSAADDAAGLAIATGLQSQVNGDNTAITNANNGVGLLQTAEGALTTISNNLQTIRELAVESANSTNTAQDRAALNTEAQQLISEIDRVATSTSFNNVSLLNGSFSNAAFQVGANAGQTITIAQIASARTTDLRSSAPGYLTTVTGNADTILTPSATVFTAISYATLSVGALTINNVAIGSSKAGTVSADQTSNSAWALANAINAASGTGVKATAEATSTGAFGSATVVAALAAGDITINGIAIGSVSLITTGSGVAQAAAVAQAINLKVAQTGVSASANNGKISLTSAEGGNIALTLGAGAVNVGLGAAAGTTFYQGRLLLGAVSGSITIGGSSVTALASPIGVSGGTYYQDAAGHSGSSPAAIVSGDLTINGVSINPPVQGGAGQTADSAWALANAINSASGTGVKATANATVTGQLASATVFTAISTGAITINGVALGTTTGSVAVASTANGVQEGIAVAKAINLITSETGVTATADSLTGRITLTAADGRDITIANVTATTASTAGLGPVGNAGAGPRTYQGSITLTSTASSGIAIKGTSASSAGLTTGSTEATAIAQITVVADINISTASGAAAAITTVDSALNQLNLLNANLGAYQNRFESAITTLQNTSNNLSSAKSNIQDADYAVETSNLTKALITQQAGISILAQANTLPQYILALLPKG